MDAPNLPGARTPAVVFVAATCAANVLALALPLVLMQIYDRVLPGGNMSTLRVLMVGLAMAMAAELVLRIARSRLLCHAGARHEFGLAQALHRTLLDADLEAVGAQPLGVHLDRLRPLESWNEARYGDGRLAMLELPFAIAFIVAIGVISAPLAAILAGIVAAAWIPMRAVSRARTALATDRADLEGRRTAFLVDVLGALETVKGLAAGPFMERRYERLMAASARLGGAIAANEALIQGIGAAVTAAAPVFVAMAGAAMVLDGDLTVGALAAVILLSNRITSQLLRMGLTGHGEREHRRQDRDLAATVALRPAGRGRRDPGPIERIELRGLRLADPGTGLPILDGVDLDLAPGQSVRIDGAVGSGKTALLNAIAGQLRPAAGRVLLNGVDIGECDPHAVRRQIALLPQQHTLLEGTLFENMTRFRPDLHGREALEIAAALGLDRFFEEHRSGLSTPVRRGVALGLPAAISDRVALVGALVGRPRLILFDEANLSLDADGDRRLHALLEDRRAEAAMVLVTQRPSYCTLCDRTYRLEAGRLVPGSAPQVPALHDLSARRTA